MHRRSLLQTLTATPLALTPFPALAASVRKQPVITGLDVFREEEPRAQIVLVRNRDRVADAVDVHAAADVESLRDLIRRVAQAEPEALQHARDHSPAAVEHPHQVDLDDTPPLVHRVFPGLVV